MRHALLVLALCAACGDDGSGLAPPPDHVEAGGVVLRTDPLRLELDSPGGPIAQDAFVEIATVPAVDATHYYDPRAPGTDPLTWAVPAKATGLTSDGWLVLDGGARLRLVAAASGAGATLELDAAPVAGAVLARLVLPIAAGEPVFGFGESFGGADAVGQLREAQFRVDGAFESGLNEAHVPVPLALWPRHRLGLFVRDRRVGAFDVGATRPGSLLATFGLPERGAFGFELFTAATPLDLSRAYAARTALPAVPPRWAFAPQQWRNEHHATSEVLDDAHQMRALGIPGSVMWIDNPWQTGYNTFVFDEQRFVAIDAALAELRTLGYRVIVWSTPYLLPTGASAADYGEARRRGLVVTDDAGAPIDFPWKEGPVALIDFTNPEATAFWRERIGRVVARGISGFKLDYGEDVVPELYGARLGLRTAAGDNQEVHGIFNRSYHDAYLGALPAGDGFLITRAGAWGEQDRNTAIWPGDLDSDFSRHGVDNGDGERNVGGLPAAIAGGLSLSVSGYPFYGSDIGGYREALPTSEALIRWSQYAALGTIMQLGGGGPSHNPWDATLFDPAALSVYRTFARLHLDLNPLIWSLAVVAGRDGTPVNRPCRFVYPEAACDDAMFLLGDDVLVAPVIEPGATTRTVVLPPGRWIDWWTGAATDGDGVTAITAAAPLDTLPLWRAANRFVPMFARAADTLEPATAPGVTSYADPAYGGELRLWITPTGPGTDLGLHDGGHATAGSAATGYGLGYQAGTEYRVITFDLDTTGTTIPHLSAPAQVAIGATPIAAVADEAALFACPDACWLWEPAAHRLRVRAHVTAAVDLLISGP